MPSEFTQRLKEQYLYEVTSIGGNVVYLIMALIFLILKDYPVFGKLVFGLVLIYSIIVIIKQFYFKNRPAKYKYSSFIEKIDASSFPSLHASRTAFLAAVLMKYFNNTGISIILGILVLAVAYSRIRLEKHDFMDVSAGIVFGILVYFGVNIMIG